MRTGAANGRGAIWNKAEIPGLHIFVTSGLLNSLKVILVVLSVIVVVESAIIASPYLSGAAGSGSGATYVPGVSQTFSLPYDLFNQPIINDTNQQLRPTYNYSWVVTIQSSLVAPAKSSTTEAQIALAPTFKAENLSIPTIIIQERADGLLRIEYYAQDWNKTFGMVLFNSSFPPLAGQNLTLRFVDFGPASVVNPQIAPRPNGNLSVFIGSVEVVSDFPIGWASLSHAFIYGLQGSSYTAGSMKLTIQSLERK